MTCLPDAQYSMSPKHPSALPRRPAVRACLVALTGGWLLGLPVLAAAQEGAIKPAESGLTQAGRFEREKRYPEALAKVEEAIRAEPDQPRPRFLKGVILMDLGRLDEAAALFQEMRESFPELPEPYNNLAVILIRQGKLEQARNALEIAILAYPGYAAAHENLGDVHARMAAAEYARAARLEPGKAERKYRSLVELVGEPGGATDLPQGR